MNEQTLQQHDIIVERCKDLFTAKLKDYGPSWLIFRLPSLTDQILIKAKRIRTLEELKGKSLVPEGAESEYIGILNYCVMALMKIWYADSLPDRDALLLADLKVEDGVLIELYEQVVTRTKELMLRKNHDYGEAWRDMRISSITDQILVKIQRIKALEESNDKPLVSEDIDAQYSDILNYSIFALFKLTAL